MDYEPQFTLMSPEEMLEVRKYILAEVSSDYDKAIKRAAIVSITFLSIAAIMSLVTIALHVLDYLQVISI